MSKAINIKNYEAYVIDYLDDNLDATSKTAFEAFLLAHPEIAEEISGLRQFPLLTKESTSNFNKADLKLTIHPEAGIDENNYEENFALLVNTKIPSEKASVEAFLRKNPILESDWIRYQKTLLRADESVVFPIKSHLKQSIPLWPVSTKKIALRVAAAVTVLLGAYSIYQNIQYSTRYIPREKPLDLSLIAPLPLNLQTETDEVPLPKESSPNVDLQKTEGLAASPERLGLQKINTLSAGILLQEQVAIPQRSFAAYIPTIPQGLEPQEDQSSSYASTTTELNLNQFVGKNLLGLDPEKTKTTTALVKEGLIKTMNNKTELEYRELLQENKSNTIEFLAGNFGVKRITYAD